MKNVFITVALIAALFVVPVARAETVECSTSQYGGSVCGVTTSTETVVEHKTVDAGISDWQLWQVVAAIAGVAAISTILYRTTYKLYILG